jgi:hypothetical protein
MRPVASLVVILAMALLTLVAIYHAIRLCFPPWVAVCVTTGVGVSTKFIQNAHDLMSDVPHLLGVSLVLLGGALLMRRRTRGGQVGGGILLIAGGALALWTRPTFWALAAAWGITSAIGLIVGPRRGAHAFMLLTLVGLAGAFIALDPRSSGSTSVLSGTYERKALDTLGEVARFRIGDRAVALFEEAIPEAFYGIELGVGIDTVASIVILGSVLLLVRSVPFWALYVAIAAVMLFIFGPIPRYFLMVLPLLLLSVSLLLYRISRLVPQRNFLPELVMLLGTGIVVVPNLVRNADLFMEQHALTFQGRTAFLERYRDGDMHAVVRICQAITEPGSSFYVEPHQLILSHEPRIMSYLSGRRAYRAGELVPDDANDDDAAAAARIIRDMNIEFGVFPAAVYDDEELTRRLIEQNMITPAPDAPALVVNDVRFTRIRVAP